MVSLLKISSTNKATLVKLIRYSCINGNTIARKLAKTGSEIANYNVFNQKVKRKQNITIITVVFNTRRRLVIVRKFLCDIVK